ncbi:MAG TPA: hypothetical protein VF198_05140 [Vicinamibacterales bacterium]
MHAKQNRGRLTGLIRAVLIVGAATSPVGCGGGNTPETIVTDEVVHDDLLTAGQRVRVEAEVEGDVAAAGSNVAILAPVQGYIMGAGRTVTIAGPVDNDVWAAGERVTVDARVGDNAMIAGQTVRLAPGSVIGRSARLAGNDVRSEGRITRDLRIGAGRAEIGGEVGGAVHANAERVTVLPGTVVRGDLVVRSPRPPDISPDARVMGRVDYQETRGESWGVAWPLEWVGLFLALLVLSLAALALAPAWSERVVGQLRRRTWASLLAGAIVLIAVPLVIAILLVTVIGIPLAIVLTAAYAAALVLSAAVVSYLVGRWLFERAHRAGVSRWGAIALGALVVSLGLSLPFLGPIVALAVVLWGAGAVAMEWRDRRRTGLQPA